MRRLGRRGRMVARYLAMAGAAWSALMFALVLSQGLGAAPLPPGSVSSGAVTLNPSTGTSAVSFQVIPPVGADCPGAGADNYRYHSYITPIANDPSQLQYSPTGTPGPAPTQNLRAAAGPQIRSLTPAIGNNFLAQQTASFASAAWAALPAGQYWVGFACTVPDGQVAPGDNSGSQDGFLDIVEFWATAVTVAAQDGAGPNNFTFTVNAEQPPPATTTAPPAATTAATTTAPSATTAPLATTTAPPATTASAATTTIAGATTTAAGSASTTTGFALPPAGGSGGGSTGGTGSGGTLAATGSSSAILLFWALLFLAFGRMVVLLGRTPKVLPARRR